MYDGGLKRFGFGVNHHGGTKTRSHFGRGFIFLLESLGFGLFIAFGKPSLILGEDFMLVVRRLGL